MLEDENAKTEALVEFLSPLTEFQLSSANVQSGIRLPFAKSRSRKTLVQLP